jgi:transposase
VPETVALARARSTRRRMFRAGRPPAGLVQKGNETMIRKVMEAIYQSVAGLDVHEQTVVACRRRLVADGLAEMETQPFATTRTALQTLLVWLAEWGVTHVAMESTGIYWVPVWNVLEGQFQLLLANAQQLKKVPGRKADVSDAEWIAQCQQCGLLRASFVPSAEIREWRQMTRQRTKLVDHRTALINRLHAVLQQGNYKLGQVASNIVGVSGRAILQALSAGEHDAAKLAALAQGRLHASLAELVAALDGELSANQQWLVGRLLQQIASVEREIERYSARIRTQMRAYDVELERLDTISGVGRRVAENLLAEIGPEMTPFPTDDQLVSWAALCPGKEQSGNKRGKTRMAKGNRWLKRVLTEAAWAATHEHQGYLAALYRRIAPRRGKKRAIIAVARTILQAAWHILKEGVTYRELGGDYFERLQQEATAQQLVQRLERLGYTVEVQAKAAAS